MHKEVWSFWLEWHTKMSFQSPQSISSDLKPLPLVSNGVLWAVWKHCWCFWKLYSKSTSLKVQSQPNKPVALVNTKPLMEIILLNIYTCIRSTFLWQLELLGNNNCFISFNTTWLFIAMPYKKIRPTKHSINFVHHFPPNYISW